MREKVQIDVVAPYDEMNKAQELLLLEKAVLVEGETDGDECLLRWWKNVPHGDKLFSATIEVTNGDNGPYAEITVFDSNNKNPNDGKVAMAFATTDATLWYGDYWEFWHGDLAFTVEIVRPEGL